MDYFILSSAVDDIEIDLNAYLLYHGFSIEVKDLFPSRINPTSTTLPIPDGRPIAYLRAQEFFPEVCGSMQHILINSGAGFNLTQFPQHSLQPVDYMYRLRTEVMKSLLDDGYGNLKREMRRRLADETPARVEGCDYLAIRAPALEKLVPGFLGSHEASEISASYQRSREWASSVLLQFKPRQFPLLGCLGGLFVGGDLFRSQFNRLDARIIPLFYVPSPGSLVSRVRKLKDLL